MSPRGIVPLDIRAFAATPRKSGGRFGGTRRRVLSLARHAHACTRVTAARTARKTGQEEGEEREGGVRCRRVEQERSRKRGREEEEAARRQHRRRGRRRRSRRKRAKGAPVGGYRENEARHRVPHGPFSRHGARRRPQQPGPGRRGPPRGTAGPCSRQRQRQARASHATRTRPSRSSREHKPRFFHPRR